MGLDPKSKYSDAIGNLYRAALFMVKGQVNLSLSFLEKAHRVLGKKLPNTISRLVRNKEEIASKKKQLFWAEKILDQYHRLKNPVIHP